jgi:hypothetical protein
VQSRVLFSVFLRTPGDGTALLLELVNTKFDGPRDWLYTSFQCAHQVASFSQDGESVSSTAAVPRTSLLRERDPGLYARRYWTTVEDPAAYGSTADLSYYDRSVRVTGAISVSSTATVSRTSLLGERDPGLYARRHWPTVEDTATYGSTADLSFYSACDRDC